MGFTQEALGSGGTVSLGAQCTRGGTAPRLQSLSPLHTAAASDKARPPLSPSATYCHLAFQVSICSGPGLILLIAGEVGLQVGLGACGFQTQGVLAHLQCPGLRGSPRSAIALRVTPAAPRGPRRACPGHCQFRGQGPDTVPSTGCRPGLWVFASVQPLGEIVSPTRIRSCPRQAGVWEVVRASDPELHLHMRPLRRNRRGSQALLSPVEAQKVEAQGVSEPPGELRLVPTCLISSFFLLQSSPQSRSEEAWRQVQWRLGSSPGPRSDQQDSARGQREREHPLPSAHPPTVGRSLGPGTHIHRPPWRTGAEGARWSPTQAGRTPSRCFQGPQLHAALGLAVRAVTLSARVPSLMQPWGWPWGWL